MQQHIFLALASFGAVPLLWRAIIALTFSGERQNLIDDINSCRKAPMTKGEEREMLRAMGPYDYRTH